MGIAMSTEETAETTSEVTATVVGIVMTATVVGIVNGATRRMREGIGRRRSHLEEKRRRREVTARGQLPKSPLTPLRAKRPSLRSLAKQRPQKLQRQHQ